MPLSPRFEELMDELELKDALWHLQRANAWVNQATEEELMEWYSRILQLAQNTGECITRILEKTTQELSRMLSRESLLKNRNIYVHDSCERRDNWNYNKTICDLAEHVRLSRLVKQAQILQQGEWVQIRDITASIQLLPDKITWWDQTIVLNKARILAILPTHAAAA
jgi:hypothetical protein